MKGRIGASFIAFIFLSTFLSGCLSQRRPVANPKTVAQTSLEIEKKRPKIRSRFNKYEGSLWRDEASFGNLLRDHRARFRHDLITIKDINKIVSVPAPKKKDDAPRGAVGKASAVLESLSLKETLEEEQNEILRSLDTMSAEVIKVLPNGNMMIRGRKVDYRQRNEVQYVTTIIGILRPADVDESNIVSAEQLVYPEVKVKRRILGDLLRQRIQSLQPLIGKQNAGFLERLSDFSKAGGGSSTKK